MTCNTCYITTGLTSHDMQHMLHHHWVNVTWQTTSDNSHSSLPQEMEFQMCSLDSAIHIHVLCICSAHIHVYTQKCTTCISSIQQKYIYASKVTRNINCKRTHTCTRTQEQDSHITQKNPQILMDSHLPCTYYVHVCVGAAYIQCTWAWEWG